MKAKVSFDIFKEKLETYVIFNVKDGDDIIIAIKDFKDPMSVIEDEKSDDMDNDEKK